ncbi:hypothetical protein LMG29739_04581 [Paraburkholderia solisilvae]|uniref:Uncharacterized protein n=2 Tax=Paraburkholderia solisilvae TaxID=624376 RepID=A0A6J5EG13_9BURK|nr:hypothetical protein LMG29739_04581 [Paraburkholderia solisilvae]
MMDARDKDARSGNAGCGAMRRAPMRPLARALTGGLLLLAAVALPPVAQAAKPAASAASPASADAPSSPITPAERMLFMTPHLRGVAAQTELDYSMILSKPPEKASDTVRVLVQSPDNSASNASVSDRSGEVKVPSGGLPCNPVILYFLEHDIAEMEQWTGGQRRYFQKRVRLALAANPPVTEVTSNANGKPVKAHKIEIQPYLNDPNAQRFPDYVGKRYTFVFADDVPGGVSLIRTEVPGENSDFAHPRLVETLAFQGALRKLPPPEHGAPAPPPNGPRASR